MKNTSDPAADRKAKTDAIVTSPSPKRLIVAGPGTGKSQTFAQALSARGGAGLALTFIRFLVADLERDLGTLALVDTFHGYCKGRLHAAGGAGLGAGFRMYPKLLDLVAADLESLGTECSQGLLEARFHEMDDTNGLLTMALDIAAYYKAVSFPDSLYRLTLHFDAHPEDIPTYPLVVIDEYQDFNRLETRLIEQLAQKSYVLIAGDDDQAVYDRKHADPKFIRILATDGSFDVFPLPYCSRCTHVIVAAVKRVIEYATNAHLLDGRLAKDFEPYPDKEPDSASHPLVIHADCSTHKILSPYMARYVDQQIAAIPAADIELSYKGKHPTALVIGPSYFMESMAKHLLARGHQVELRMSPTLEIDLATGYRLIAADKESRLGWRIVHASMPCESVDAQLATVLGNDSELAAAFCGDCMADHLSYVDLVRRLFEEEQLHPDEEQKLRSRLNEKGDLMSRLAEWTEEKHETKHDESRARVVCTSLIGSKGLSAEHVFIVGFNNGDFPRDPASIKPIEICQLIVALSRTRKACHLVSCRRYGAQARSPSIFVKWLGDLVEHRWIDKNYW